ncbi:hypothetical protein GCM10025787_17140 [Saccharopolyspora rosea]
MAGQRKSTITKTASLRTARPILANPESHEVFSRKTPTPGGRLLARPAYEGKANTDGTRLPHRARRWAFDHRRRCPVVNPPGEFNRVPTHTASDRASIATSPAGRFRKRPVDRATSGEPGPDDGRSRAFAPLLKVPVGREAGSVAQAHDTTRRWTVGAGHTP